MTTPRYVPPAFKSPQDLQVEIEAVIESRETLIVGPWLTEVGFEVLYWVPFIRWLVQTYNIDKRRLVIVSRGGVADWYGDMGGRYVEIFDYREATGLRQASDERYARQAGTVKHFHHDNYDQQLMAEIAADLSLVNYGLIHPSFMYRSLNPFWGRNRPLRQTLSMLIFEKRPPTPHPMLAQLPESYFAVKFYERFSLPASTSNRWTVQRVIDQLSEQAPVVLLDRDFSVDEHVSFATAAGRSVISIADLTSLRSNLGDQSAAIAGSRAMVGTYGGMSYVSLLYGRPVVGFYSAGHHLLDVHGPVVQTMADTLGVPFTAAHVDAVSCLIGGA